MDDFVKALSGLTSSKTTTPSVRMVKFHFAGLDPTQEAFELGKYLDIIDSGFTFEKFLDTAYSIAHQIQNKSDLSKLPEGELKPILQTTLFEIACEYSYKGTGFDLDESGQEVLSGLAYLDPFLEKNNFSQLISQNDYLADLIDAINIELGKFEHPSNFYYSQDDNLKVITLNKAKYGGNMKNLPG